MLYQIKSVLLRYLASAYAQQSDDCVERYFLASGLVGKIYSLKDDC